MKHPTPMNMKNQSGVVLIVALVMLVIMSILGITSVRTVALEEKMSAAAHDRSIALRAAEAALLAGQRESEFANRAASGIVLPERLDGASLTYTSDIPAINQGYAATHDRILADDWMVDGVDWTNNNQTRTLSNTVDLGPLVTDEPRYFIEYRGMTSCFAPELRDELLPSGDVVSKGIEPPPLDCRLFRITARSQPAGGRAVVFLQSLYATQ